MDTVAQLDQPAPDFSLPDLQGKLHRLAEMRGRIVLLSFWSAECPWSERGDRILLDLASGWDEEISLWSVASNANESPDQLQRAAAERGVPVVLWDKDHAVADAFGALTTPHLFLIDAEGILRYKGAIDDTTWRQKEPTRSYLKDAVQAVREGRSPDPADTPGRGCTIMRHAV